MSLGRCARGLLIAATTTSVAASALAAGPAPTKSECIDASESGQDLRRAGKFRDARAQFASCVAAGCPAPIREDCAERLDEVAKAMPSVVFDVTDEDGNEVPGVKITVDGQVVPDAGSAGVELDPGSHAVVFEAAGLKKVEEQLVFVEKVKRRREVVIMGSVTATQGAAAESSRSNEGTTRSGGPPATAWVAFGVGGAGLLLGVTAGLIGGGKHSMLVDACGSGTCPPQYANDLDAFHTWRTVSTVGYVVGALGTAAGAVLWLTTPKERDAVTAAVWFGVASAGMTGRF